ncbi:MAG: hypothetical protein LBM93_03080 [Oscillospiraceae bacterium]|jgi:hypothetical protein|nr:hypothetical protein [Oscillospiraceae bacterium]
MKQKTLVSTVFSILLLLMTFISVFATETPTIMVGTAEGKPGDTISIPISISGNTGIIAFYCGIDYDNTQIKLTKVTNGSVLTGAAHSGTLTAKPYRLCFDMSLGLNNNTNNGIVATLEFEILQTAVSGNSKIVITYNPEEIYDYNLNNVYFDIVFGSVVIDSPNKETSRIENTSSDESSQNSESSVSTLVESTSEVISIDVDPEPSTSEDKLDVSVTPSDTTPWDKVSIIGDDINETSQNSKSSVPPIVESTPEVISIDVDPKPLPSTPEDKIDVSITPSDITPWNKVTIIGNEIKDKNIISEQTNEGLKIRGDNLSGAKVEIKKDGKTAFIDIDTDKNEILIKENENGNVDTYMDEDGDGIFESKLIPPTAFKKTPVKNSHLALKILILFVVGVILFGIFVFIVRKKSNHQNKINTTKCKSKDNSK